MCMGTMVYAELIPCNTERGYKRPDLRMFPYVHAMRDIRILKMPEFRASEPTEQILSIDTGGFLGIKTKPFSAKVTLSREP